MAKISEESKKKRAPAFDIYSFGHGVSSQDEIIAALKSQGIQHVVDVRTLPGSNRNPHVNRANMSKWLPENGISYTWLPGLGGYRPKSAESAKDTAWHNASFRNYAGYTRSKGFDEGLKTLIGISKKEKTAFMCSESVWWRCHRRIISDYLEATKGMKVGHIMQDGKVREHVINATARPDDHDHLVYDQEQT